MKKTQIFAGILCLGITATLMTGCGKSGTVVSDKEDDCIVVELPDDYGVRDIFNIVSSTEISVSAISDPTVAQFYMIGKLEDGGSVVCRSKEEQTFVYTEKEVKSFLPVSVSDVSTDFRVHGKRSERCGSQPLWK